MLDNQVFVIRTWDLFTCKENVLNMTQIQSYSNLDQSQFDELVSKVFFIR